MTRPIGPAATLSAATCLASVALLSGCEQAATSATAPLPALSDDDAESATIQPIAAEFTKPAPVTSDRVLPRTFDDIKFDIEPDAPFERGMLTDGIEELAGKRIEIRGYILPSFRNKLRDFVLVRDDQECCFGPGAALYDCILVDMAPGKVAEFSTRPVAVEGVFRIEPLDLAGQTRAVFRMTADEVE